MKNFWIYLLVLITCGIGALVLAAMIRDSLWWSFALLLPVPNWRVFSSLFVALIAEKAQCKTIKILFACVAFIVFLMFIGMDSIGTTSFFGLSFALFLILSGFSTIRLIYMISNKKAKQELIAEESQEPEEK